MYWIDPKCCVHPKYRAIPDISGYPIPDDFQNWVEYQKGMLGSGLVLGTRRALVMWRGSSIERISACAFACTRIAS